MARDNKRVRVERGLYRRGKRYEACVTPTGATAAVWRSLGEVGLMEARRLRDEFAAEIRATPAAAVSSRATFEELADDWIAQQRVRRDAGELAARTFESYESALRLHVLPAFGSRQLRSLTPDQLVSWVRGLRAAGYAAYSVQNYWKPVNLVLRHAVRRGCLASNPADRLTSFERPKPGPGRRRALDKSEMQRLLAATPDRYRVAVAAGLFSGLRLSELLGLTWADVRVEQQVLRVRHQMARNGKRTPLKTPAARRDVILIPQLADALGRHRRSSSHGAADDLVFCTSAGLTVGHRNLTARGLEKAVKRSGLEGVTFHVLRHTFASLLISEGHDPVFVSRQLGHANAAITLKVYAHLFDAARHADDARSRLGAGYGHLLREPGGGIDRSP